MAATAPAPFVKPPNASSTVDHKPQVPKVTSIKTIAESPNLKSIPSQFTCTTNPFEHADPNDPQFSVPIIDYSLLTSISPEQRSKTIHDLANVCQDWGFFMLINHGVPESLMKGMIDVCHKFFQLPEEDKKKLETSYGVDPEKDKNKLKTNFGLDPIKYGTGGNIWRDYLQVIVYPEFHTLDKPAEFREVSLEFTKRTREVALEVLKAISESLGLEADYIYKAMNLESGLQLMAANYYPPCPQPEHTIGMNYHTDPGMVTFLIDNEISGLQVEHNGKWVTVNSMPNAYLVNLSDHLQILTNKKYKSVMHQASVSNKTTRMVQWENIVLDIEEQFKKISCCSSRSLTEQDLELLRRISGCQEYMAKENFERMWCWLYPVAVTISRQGINAMWSSTSPRWIEGFITKEEAELSLKGPRGLQEPGTFILRFPTSRSWPHPDAGSLVVTYVGCDAIHHKLLSLDLILSSGKREKELKPLQDMLLAEPELSRLGRIVRSH